MGGVLCESQLKSIDACHFHHTPTRSAEVVGEEADDDDEVGEEADEEAVEVGTKTGVSVAATAHDERPGRSNDEVGCGETGEGGCEPYLAHDGDSGEIESRWSCATKIVEDGAPCEIEFLFDEPQDIVDIRVAFWKGDQRSRTLEVRWGGGGREERVRALGGGRGYVAHPRDTVARTNETLGVSAANPC